MLYLLYVNGGCGHCYGSVDIIGIAVVIAQGGNLNRDMWVCPVGLPERCRNSPQL